MRSGRNPLGLQICLHLLVEFLRMRLQGGVVAVGYNPELGPA